MGYARTVTVVRPGPHTFFYDSYGYYIHIGALPSVQSSGSSASSELGHRMAVASTYLWPLEQSCTTLALHQSTSRGLVVRVWAGAGAAAVLLLLLHAGPAAA